MMQMRTHTCNELRLSDVGKSVKIVGWMENVREVGGWCVSTAASPLASRSTR